MTDAESATINGQRSDNALKISVVGAGDIGRRHMRAIRENPESMLAGIVDPLPNGAIAAGEFQVPLFSDIDSMIDAIAPDGVIIATPNALHVSLAEKCINRGVAILIEKPIAENTASAYALADQAEQKGVAVVVGHHRRHNPIVARAREMIEQGVLGAISVVSATWLVRKPEEYFNVQWRTAQGGGPVLINLIHDIDTLRYLVGEISAVQAFSSNSRRRFDVEDTAVVVLRFASGALGTIALSDAAPSPWSWELTSGEVTSYTYPKVNSDCYLLSGSLAALAVPSLRVWRHQGQQSWRAPLIEEQYVAQKGDPLAIQISHFMDVIRGARPLVSAREGARTLEVTLAVTEAARTGKMVHISPAAFTDELVDFESHGR